MKFFPQVGQVNGHSPASVTGGTGTRDPHDLQRTTRGIEFVIDVKPHCSPNLL
jgi:hypothetical protein